MLSAARPVVRLLPVVVLACSLQAARQTAPPAGAASAGDTRYSDARLLKIARRYEVAVNRRDADAISAMFDMDSLLERTLDGMVLSPADRAQCEAGLRSSLDWGGALAGAVGDAGHFKLLGTFRADGRSLARYRLVNDMGGLNYHDVEFAAIADGSTKIVDCYIYLAGETMSRTIRRSLDDAFAAERRGERGLAEGSRLMQQMTALANRGDFADALATYERLPKFAKRSKPVMILRVMSAVQVSKEAADEASDEFRRLFPDDPSLDLITFDQLFLARQWSEALAALERLAARVGKDAYLDDLAATVCRQAGRLDEAKAFARRAIDREPTLEAGYWTLMDIALAERDHASVAGLLSQLEKGFDYSFDGLATAAPYAEFVESDAYRQWQASRRTAGVLGE